MNIFRTKTCKSSTLMLSSFVASANLLQTSIVPQNKFNLKLQEKKQSLLLTLILHTRQNKHFEGTMRSRLSFSTYLIIAYLGTIYSNLCNKYSFESTSKTRIYDKINNNNKKDSPTNIKSPRNKQNI